MRYTHNTDRHRLPDVLQLWRSAQEVIIEQKQREACSLLYPAVTEVLDKIAPDAPSSHACKCTMCDTES